MAEENQVEPQQITKEPQQITKEPQGEAQRVTTKNPKKVEAGKRLAESNRKKREAKKREQAKLEASKPILRNWGCLSSGSYRWSCYYIYQTKKVEQPKQNNPRQQLQTQPQTNKFEMD